MTRFSVDTASLRTLVERLDGLKSQLGGVADLGSNHSGLGSPEVSGAVDVFCSGWKSAMAQVDANIAAVADRVQRSADDYETVESSIASAQASEGAR